MLMTQVSPGLKPSASIERLPLRRSGYLLLGEAGVGVVQMNLVYGDTVMAFWCDLETLAVVANHCDLSAVSRIHLFSEPDTYMVRNSWVEHPQGHQEDAKST